jgi:hypothetical protein
MIHQASKELKIHDYMPYEENNFYKN